MYMENFVHHLGKSHIRKTLIRIKTTFKGAHNLNCKFSLLLREFGFGFSPSLGEVIASKNIDITNTYTFIQRETEMA